MSAENPSTSADTQSVMDSAADKKAPPADGMSRPSGSSESMTYADSPLSGGMRFLAPAQAIRVGASQYGVDFRETADNLNAGFERVTPTEGGAINTSVPSEFSANGFNLPTGIDGKQNIVTDPNKMGVSDAGAMQFLSPQQDDSLNRNVPPNYPKRIEDGI